MKRIVLCADDYGQAPAINAGILALVASKRLSAVSCMVNAPYWNEAASSLLPYQNDIDIGLHFNLTEGAPLSAQYQAKHGSEFVGLSKTILNAFLLQLDSRVVAAECMAQIDAFEAATGFLPRFIDGHQHIQHFPVIRSALLSVYRERLRQANTYIRLVDMRLNLADLISKKAIIHATGVRRFRQRLLAEGVPHNRSFSGSYAFARAWDYPALFRGFLQDIQDGGLIMCHPGLQPDGVPDAIGDSRYLEYQYLSGPQFEQDCHAAGVILTRYLS